MYNKAMFELGNQPSVIRELFAYGLQQAKIVGPEMPSTTHSAIRAFRPGKG